MVNKSIKGSARDLLQSRVQRAGCTSAILITRRSFLLGSSAVLLNPLSIIGVPSAKAASNTPHLNVFHDKQGFELVYREQKWKVLTKKFVSDTKSKISIPSGTYSITDKVTIEFSGWRFVGFYKLLNFRAKIFLKDGTWKISLSFHPIGQDESTMDLLDWMAGKYVNAYVPKSHRYSVGDKHRLSVTGSERTIEWNHNLTAIFRDNLREINYIDSGISEKVPPQRGTYGFSASRLEVEPTEPSPLLKSIELSSTSSKSEIESTTVLKFFGIKSIYLGKTNAGQYLTLELRSNELFEAKNGPPVTIETYEIKRVRKGILAAKGTGTLLVDTPGQSVPTRLHLEEFCLVCRVGSMAQELDFAAKLSTRKFTIDHSVNKDSEIALSSSSGETGGFGVNAGPISLRISGTKEIIQQRFIGGKAGSLVFPARLLKANIPVSGSSHAEIAFEDTDVDIVIGHRVTSSKCSLLKSGDTTFPFEEGLCVTELSLTNKLVFHSPLERARLRLARSTDLFDLQFEFLKYNLIVEDGISRLIARRGGPKRSSEFDRPRRVVIFYPQHVQEEVFHYKKGSGEEKPESLSGEELPLKTLVDEDKPGAIRTPSLLSNSKLSQTRVSGPTRLVFEEKLDEEASKSRDTEITVETITDWVDLALVVHERALPRNATLEDQLDLIKITSNTSRNEAKSKVSRSLTPPQYWETSLEPVTGLLFSPDSSAFFTTPRVQPVTGEATIWESKLHLRPSSAVRAIYARGLDDTYLNNLPSEDTDYLPFVSSLNAKDRREIVGMTSVYGVAALRRLQLNDEKDKIFDDPKGMVIRPETSYEYLSQETEEYNGIDVFQEGILVPKPFIDFDLSLSSQGGTLISRWEGEPPAPIDKDPFFQDAFRIESYIHRTKYERDVLVQVTYKGFLFPLGHRAAYIKLSERTILPFSDNEEKLMPTAYLTMRHFIVVRKPKKVFPALNQPNSSREFPAKTVEILTTITPDLHTPEEIELGVKLGEGNEKREKQAAHIFWPRTGPDAGSEVEFELRINDEEATAYSKLIFVDNKAAHSPEVLKTLIEEYTKGDKSEIFKDIPRGRIVNHAGALRKYADTSRAGETSFRTESWALGVEGRAKTPVVPSDTNKPNSTANSGEKTDQAYVMDALMEGKDQPPFYPRIESANIEMQSVDRMLGRPQGLITVKLNSDIFVKHGFDPIRNPSEIYLEIKEPTIKLDFTNQGQSSGGVAKPNAYLAAISRKIGFVGGLPRQTQKSVLQLSTQDTKTTSTSSEEVSNFEFDGAKVGKFDPYEFIPDGKILGILEIRDLVKAATISFAPQLKEVYQFAALAIETLEEPLLKELPKLSDSILKVIEKADASLKETLKADKETLKADKETLKADKETLKADKETLKADIDVSDIYPELVNELKNFAVISKQVEGKAKKVNWQGDVQIIAKELAACLTELHSAGKSLIETIDDVIDNPTPAIVGETIKKFHDYHKTIQQALKKFSAKDHLKDFKNEVFKTFCEKLVEEGTFEFFFGTVAYEDTTKAVVQFPSRAPTSALPFEIKNEREESLKAALVKFDEAFKKIINQPDHEAPDLPPEFKEKLENKINSLQQVSKKMKEPIAPKEPELLVKLERIENWQQAAKAMLVQIEKYYSIQRSGEAMPYNIRELNDKCKTIYEHGEYLQRVYKEILDHEEHLQRACTEMLENPEHVAANLQRGLLYEVYGRLASQLLLELKKIELGSDALFPWSYRKLGETLTGVLKLGFHDCRAKAVYTAAWKIVDIAKIELQVDNLKGKLNKGLTPEATIDSCIQSIASKSTGIIEAMKSELKQDLDQEKAQLDSLKVKLTDKSKEAFKAQATEEKEAKEKEVRALEVDLGALERQNKALKQLYDKANKAKSKEVIRDFVQPALIRELATGPLSVLKADIEAKAKQLGDNLLSKLIGSAFLLIDQLQETVVFEQLSSAYNEKRDSLCLYSTTESNETSVFAVVKRLVDALFSSTDLEQDLRDAQEVFAALHLPPEIPEEHRAKIMLELAAANRSVNTLVDVVQNFSRAKTHLEDLFKDKNEFDICENLKISLDPIEQIYYFRHAAISAVGDVFYDLKQLIGTVERLDRKQDIFLNRLQYHFVYFWNVFSELSGLKNYSKTSDSDPLTKYIDEFLDYLSIGDVGKIIRSDFESVIKEAKKILVETRISVLKKEQKNNIIFSIKNNHYNSEELEKYTFSEIDKTVDIDSVIKRVSVFVATQEKKLFARILQGLFHSSVLDSKLTVRTAKNVNYFIKGLIENIYNPIKEALQAIVDLIKKTDNSDSSQLVALIAQPSIDALETALGKVEQERKLLSNISGTYTEGTLDSLAFITSVDKFKKSLKESDGTLGIVQAINIVTGLVDSLSRGQLHQIFDFDIVREQLVAAVANLIPTRVSQSYDWDTELGSFPTNNPIFEIDRTLEITSSKDKDVVVPMTAEKKVNDLVLTTRIDVDLLTGDRTVSAVGEMRPYKIHLLGGMVDLVTIGFKGMRVVSQNGSKPEIKTTVGQVEIGQALRFLEALEPFFGPKPDDGPYVRITAEPFGVLAGYRFSAPVIPVGAMLFSGISIMAEATLPFDNQQATFAFAFASRRNPFLVAAPPGMGGGGFVSLICSPKGIIGCEIQIEMGAVIPIEFGPLRAQGRVTSGIYLKTYPGGRLLEGFVRSVGEGSIGCFSTSVCLEVTIRQESGGSMVGASSFSFTFKLGFAELSYGLTASYEIQGGDKQTRQEGQSLLANNSNGERLLPQAKFSSNIKDVWTIKSAMPNRRNEWAKYKRCFAI